MAATFVASARMAAMICGCYLRAAVISGQQKLEIFAGEALDDTAVVGT
jgi:hypothetical protein